MEIHPCILYMRLCCLCIFMGSCTLIREMDNIKVMSRSIWYFIRKCVETVDLGTFWYTYPNPIPVNLHFVPNEVRMNEFP